MKSVIGDSERVLHVPSRELPALDPPPVVVQEKLQQPFPERTTPSDGAAKTLVAAEGTTAKLAPSGMAAVLGDAASIAAQRSILLPSKALEGDLEARKNAVFKSWAADQINGDRVPHVARTFKAIVALMRGPNPPKRITELFRATLELAAKEVDKIHAVTGDPRARAHLIYGTALIALAAHSLRTGAANQRENYVYKSFPKYLNDGRAVDDGWDKCCHAISHALFAYMTLYDREYGDGTLHKAFHRAANAMNENGVGDKIAAAYDAARGRSGPYLVTCLPAPPDEQEVYFSPPADLDEHERTAYEGAVRVGDAYEHMTTRQGGYELDQIGQAVKPEPWHEDTRHALSGLRDAGVRNEFFANRAGAYCIGIRGFRDPNEAPHLPYDFGTGWPNGPYKKTQAGEDDGFRPYPTPTLCAKRAKAIKSALDHKFTTPDALLELALVKAGWSRESGIVFARLGRTKGPATVVKSKAGWAVSAPFEKGKLTLAFDPAADRERKVLSFYLRIEDGSKVIVHRSFAVSDFPMKRDFETKTDPLRLMGRS